MIWWFVGPKNGASALSMMQNFGIGSYRTSWKLLGKLRSCTVLPMRHALSGVVEVDEAFLGGVHNKAIIAVAAENVGKRLAGFVSNLDLANQPYQPLNATSEGTDLYVMGTSNNAFGWGRSYEKEEISGSEFHIHGLDDSAYTIKWYDTWSGELLKSTKVKSQNKSLVLEVPKMDEAHPDVAFKILKN